MSFPAFVIRILVDEFAIFDDVFAPGGMACEVPAMDYRQRQQRPRAYNDPGHAHELTFSCYRRYPFMTERTSEWLARELRGACEELRYSLWAYVFMPDHVHLIVWPWEKTYDDSAFLKRIKEPVGRRAVAFLK